MRRYSHDIAMSFLVLGIGGVGAWIVAVISEPSLIAVVVAVVGAIGAVTSAHLANSTRKDVQTRIGTPNGHGDVVTMMERLLAGQTGQDARLAQHDHALSELAKALTVTCRSVGAIRENCAAIKITDVDISHKVDDVAAKVSANRRKGDQGEH